MSGKAGDDSNSSFDRFAAGEGRLADLLRAMPVFEAPADMTLRFVECARAAQALHGAVRPAQAAAMTFEPPASLEAGFLADAARIQAAQQPRHDAVIEQIQAGKSAAAVLGHDVAEATSAWLAGRPQRIVAHAKTPSSPATSSKWWVRFGVLAASAFFGSVATNLWLAQRGEAPMKTAMTEASSSTPDAGKSADKSAGKNAEPVLPPPVELKIEPIAQISALSKQGSPPPSQSKEMVKKRLQEYAETQRAMKADAAAEVSDTLAADKAERADRSARNQLQEQEAAPDKRQRETLAAASAKAAPGAAPVMAPSEERFTAAPPAAPAAVVGMASPERRVARAPVAAPAPAMAKAAADQGNAPLRVSLNSAPQEAASNWQASARDHAPRIFAAHPESDAVRSWAERFRLALPADMRPAQLKIEQDSRLRDDALRLE